MSVSVARYAAGLVSHLFLPGITNLIMQLLGLTSSMDWGLRLHSANHSIQVLNTLFLDQRHLGFPMAMGVVTGSPLSGNEITIDFHGRLRILFILPIQMTISQALFAFCCLNSIAKGSWVKLRFRSLSVLRPRLNVSFERLEFSKINQTSKDKTIVYNEKWAQL